MRRAAEVLTTDLVSYLATSPIKIRPNSIEFIYHPRDIKMYNVEIVGIKWTMEDGNQYGKWYENVNAKDVAMKRKLLECYGQVYTPRVLPPKDYSFFE